MRRLFTTLTAQPVRAAVVARQFCTPVSSHEGAADDGGLAGIAPKRPKRAGVAAPSVPSAEAALPKEPKAETPELSSAALDRKLQELSKLPPEEFDRLFSKFSAGEDAEAKVLQEDSLYQMDVSLRTQHQGAARVFWKDVSVVPQGGSHPGWFGVALDGRRVKAFETKVPLVVPCEAFAHAIAREWSEQTVVVNKLNMPLTDLASGAQHVAPQAIRSRIDYLMSFFQNDNCYFRSEPIQFKQDDMIDPVAQWFGRVFDVEVPRIVGIGHPQQPPAAVNKVRDGLIAMNLNHYQIVALCVVAQFSASLMLPLALFNRVVSLETALAINRAEEGHNIANEGKIEGWHDIRDADGTVKIAASTVAWRLTSDISLAKCCEMSVVAGDGTKGDDI